jgi:dihydroorotate dehydrogenase (NAD+) catalytic subunit
VALIEVNVSCPNVAAGGMYFGADPQATAEVTRAVVRAARRPVMVKLTPLVTDITAVALAAVEAGADALSLINTLPAMAVDLAGRRPVLANTVGGLSGPAIRPVALRLVWQVARAVTVPVVGLGGIMTARDALEFLLAGARAVEVGTASFVDPKAALKVLEGIEAYFIEHEIPDLDAFVGKLNTNS